MDSAIRTVIDQQQIRDVIYRYCRGIDRCDYELVRSCYHADAVDDHVDFVGDVDGFLAYVQQLLPLFERTMHFIGNVLVEVGANGDDDRARAESYTVAYHRLRQSSTKPDRDYTVGLRYVDDFERRHGQWKIAARVCVFEWSRIDPVPPSGWMPPPHAATGQRDTTDVVYSMGVTDRHA